MLFKMSFFLFFAVSKCPAAGQGLKLSRLNARQSEIFIEFPLKDSFELLDGI